MGNPLVLHLADGRLAVIANQADCVLYAAIHGTAGEHVPRLDPFTPRVKKAKKAPQTPRQNKTTPAKAGKATRLKGEDRDKVKARAKVLHADDKTYVEVHQQLLKEGYDVKYATVWGWLQ